MSNCLTPLPVTSSQDFFVWQLMALFTRRKLLRYATRATVALGARPWDVSADTPTLNPSDAKYAASLDGAIRALAPKLSGRLITPAAPDYDLARLLFNRAFDRRPALIVRCAVASDIARTLEFAQQHDLRLAVRGGGHNRAGLSSCDGGVVIDLSAMNGVKVDPARRVARAHRCTGGSPGRGNATLWPGHDICGLPDRRHRRPDAWRRRGSVDVQVRRGVRQLALRGVGHR
jgi:FAD binding domain